MKVNNAILPVMEHAQSPEQLFMDLLRWEREQLEHKAALEGNESAYVWVEFCRVFNEHLVSCAKQVDNRLSASRMLTLLAVWWRELDSVGLGRHG